MTPPYPAAPPPPPAPPGPSRRDPFLLGAAALVLTVVVALVGALGWPTPERTLSGWQVADVPASLLVLVVATGLVCLAVAAALTRPWTWGAPVPAAVWWLLGLASVFALGWTAVFFAALGSGDNGPIIPVFDGLYTFLPVLIAALVTIPRGRPTQLRAALGTLVVTLPLLALGWALYGGVESVGRGFLGALVTTAVFGLVPATVALALTVPLNPRTAPTR